MMDTPLVIMCLMSGVSTLLMLNADEQYMGTIYAIVGMLTSFGAAGQWLASETVLPPLALIFGVLGLVNVIFAFGSAFMSAVPSEDPV